MSEQQARKIEKLDDHREESTLIQKIKDSYDVDGLHVEQKPDGQWVMRKEGHAQGVKDLTEVENFPEKSKAQTNAFKDYEKAYLDKWALAKPEILRLVSATAVANCFDGHPVWLVIYGKSGCGKTEVLRSWNRLPVCYGNSKPREQAWTCGRCDPTNGPGHQEVIEMDGKMVILTDTARIRTSDNDQQSAVLGTLVELADCNVTNSWGSGLTIDIDTKFGMIIVATRDSLKSWQKLLNILGNRLMFFFLPEHPDSKAYAKKNEPNITAIRNDLRDRFHTWWNLLEYMPPEENMIPLDSEIDQTIDLLADINVFLRVDPPLDSSGNPTQEDNDPVAPTRSMLYLQKMGKGLAIVDGRSMVNEEDSRILWEVVLSSTTDWRKREVFRALCESEDPLPVGKLQTLTGCSDSQVRARLAKLMNVDGMEFVKKTASTPYHYFVPEEIRELIPNQTDTPD